MLSFISAVAIGEFVAATNSRLFADYFQRAGREDFARTYREIERDELRHFSMLKEAFALRARLPARIGALLRGSDLVYQDASSDEGVFEKLVLMHCVFEGAAFAYMSLFARMASSGEPVNRLPQIAMTIMSDEASHMAAGHEAIAHMKSHVVSQDCVARVRNSVEVHASILRTLPGDTIVGHDEFVSALYSAYDKNVAYNTRRIFK